MSTSRISWLLAVMLLTSWPSPLGGQAPGNNANDPPALRVVVTTDLQGRLDACGCRGDTHGGLPRLASMVARLRGSCERLVLVDVGNLFLWPGQAETVAAAYATTGYDAVLLTEADRKALSEASPTSGTIPWVACDTRSGAPRHRTVVRAGLRVAIVALDEGDPDAAHALAQLRREHDFVIALCRAEEGRATELARDLPVDLLCVPSATPARIGGTVVVGGVRGVRGVTVVEFRRDAGGRIVLQAAWQAPLDDSVERDPAVGKIVQGYYAQASDHTGLMEEARETAVGPDLSRLESLTPNLCGTCHAQQLEVWRGTPHATALTRLQAAGKLVPECAQCHSEQYRWVGQMGAPPEDGVTCTACHGDARVHAATRRAEVLWPPTEQMCRQCHTPEQQTGDFEYARELEKVRHWDSDDRGVMPPR